MELKKYPEPCLFEPAEEIGEPDDEVRELAASMFEIMYASRGIGLAAPQVGVSRRLIVINLGAAPGQGDEIALVNPEFVERSRDVVEDEEGCLSLPGLTGVVPRWRSVVVQGLDLKGGEVEIRADGLLARVLQHETDHLEGVLFIDKLGPVDRAAVKPKLREMKAKAR